MEDLWVAKGGKYIKKIRVGGREQDQEVGGPEERTVRFTEVVKSWRKAHGETEKIGQGWSDTAISSKEFLESKIPEWIENYL